MAEFGIPACRQAGALIYNVYYVYAIKSLLKNYIYVGMTNDASKRINCHQSGANATTRAYRPFEILIVEEYYTRIEARKKEKYLKSGYGKEYLRSLI